MKVYVKLRDGLWLLVTKKIEQTTVTKKRKTTRYILAGESVDSPPSIGKYESIKIPRSMVNKIISKLIDVDSDQSVVIEPKSPETCIVRAPKDLLKTIEEIVKEIITSKKSKIPKTEESIEPSSH